MGKTTKYPVVNKESTAAWPKMGDKSKFNRATKVPEIKTRVVKTS